MTDWTDRAACRGTLKVEVFFDRDPTIALAVCASCPVVAACREDADATETPNTTYGVRGGETEAMRLQRRGKRGRYGRKPATAHGTPAGYRAHRDFGEAPCEACAEAWRVYCRTLDARRPRRHRSSTGRSPSLPQAIRAEVAS